MDGDAILCPEVESRGDVVAKRVLCDTARSNRTSFMSIRCRPRDSVRLSPSTTSDAIQRHQDLATNHKRREWIRWFESLTIECIKLYKHLLVEALPLPCIVADIALVLHKHVSKTRKGEEMIIPSRLNANCRRPKGSLTYAVGLIGKTGIRKRKGKVHGEW